MAISDNFVALRDYIRVAGPAVGLDGHGLPVEIDAQFEIDAQSDPKNTLIGYSSHDFKKMLAACPNVPAIDGLLVATAIAHGLTLATCNVSHVQGLGTLTRTSLRRGNVSSRIFKIWGLSGLEPFSNGGS